MIVPIIASMTVIGGAAYFAGLWSLHYAKSAREERRCRRVTWIGLVVFSAGMAASAVIGGFNAR